MNTRLLPYAFVSMLLSALAAADEPALPQARPVPAVQVIPLPDDKASFQVGDRELTRYHFGPLQMRPFCYPMAGPAGKSLTRMGHPYDPVTHSHHNSVWLAHMSVDGVDFWPDHGKSIGRIVPLRIEGYEDGDRSAWLLAVNAWKDAEGKTLMQERRRIEVEPLTGDDWLMYIDVQLEAPADKPVELGQTPFGLVGVRMAKTIGVRDGGGRILNSEGQRNEPDAFRKPARWCDYSGPVTNQQTGGILLMDHPKNVNHPTPFHIRADGWMGACLTLDKAITIEPSKPLRLSYGLWMHAGVPSVEGMNARWQAFADRPLPGMEKPKPR
jgi:hypothetical protein